jgi:hypothetical protein
MVPLPLLNDSKGHALCPGLSNVDSARFAERDERAPVTRAGSDAQPDQIRPMCPQLVEVRTFFRDNGEAA